MMSAYPVSERPSSFLEVTVKSVEFPACKTWLEIWVIPQDPISAVVQLVGEVDTSTVDELSRAIAAQVEIGRRFVRLDVSRLTFCDCVGLSTILRAHHLLLARRGTLVLAGVSASLHRLFHVTQLEDTLFIADGPGDPPRPRQAR